MASSGSGYDLSSSTFSPDGRIFQIEYASKAVDNSGTALGLRCQDGIVLAVEKPLPHKMLVASTTARRIHSVDDHAGLAITGLVSDGRQIVNRAREEATNYDESYGTTIPPSVLASRIATYVHYFTLHGALRPFGATAIVAAYEPGTKEHQLHMVEPSGVTYEYYACAAGRGRQAAKTELEKLLLSPTKGVTDRQFVSVTEGVRQLAKIIYMLHDAAKDKPFELEMSWLCEASGWRHVGLPREVIQAATDWAKKEIEEAEEESDEDETMEE